MFREHSLTRVKEGLPCLSDRVELPAAGIDLETLERSLLVQALERTGWNQTRAATLLGLNRDQIRYRIEKFQLEKSG
jgi:two-component system, NtrC family, response regulator AtoC